MFEPLDIGPVHCIGTGVSQGISKFFDPFDLRLKLPLQQWYRPGSLGLRVKREAFLQYRPFVTELGAQEDLNVAIVPSPLVIDVPGHLEALFLQMLLPSITPSIHHLDRFIHR